jgi:threonylcarbamoyladenosine tRNA methylthiotransferase MtaB
MNRKYTTAEYEEACALLRSHFAHPAITTDVIVGFPGETEAEFAETEAFLRRIHFYEMHIFKYSRREGTRAALMADQIPEETKTVRSARLLALADQMSQEFRDYYIGRTEEVLFEEPMEEEKKRLYVGYTREYVRVAAESDTPLDNVVKACRMVRHGSGSAMHFLLAACENA